MNKSKQRVKRKRADRKRRRYQRNSARRQKINQQKAQAIINKKKAAFDSLLTFPDMLLLPAKCGGQNGEENP